MQETRPIVFLVRVQCRVKRKFTFAISSADEFLVPYVFTMLLHEKDVCPSNNWTARK